MGNLLKNLRKYQPSEGRNPTENFITEAFAWLLRKDRTLAHRLLSFISDRLEGSGKGFIARGDEVTWSTQQTFGGVYPDMVAEWKDMTLVFEHKVWAPLHVNQLQNYRNHQEAIGGDYRLILITGHRSQHAQDPDLALCWHEVYELLRAHIEVDCSESHAWVIHDFMELLRFEGLGPIAPISHTAIHHYQEAITLKTRLEAMLSRVMNELWSIPETYSKELKNKEGVLGIQFFRPGRKHGWEPGIFVGFLLEGWDHLIESRLEDGLKVCLKISIARAHHRAYPTWPEYKALVSELEAKALRSRGAWVFYNHRGEASPFNPWHPLYLERPMLEVFRGTETTEEQQQRFKAVAEEAIGMLISCPSFAAFEARFGPSTAD